MRDQKMAITQTQRMRDQKMAISRSALFALLNAFPGPDDVGPWGPIGPVIRQINRGDWVSLNPQPLPPRDRNQGPQPEPWYTARLTQGVINSVISVHQVAAAMDQPELAEQITTSSQTNIAEFVEDFCGTKWPHWPWPVPHPGPDPESQPHPIDLIVSAAQFHNAAEAVGGPLGEIFDGAAARLAEQGLANLGQ